jgi:hypothetical protein
MHYKLLGFNRIMQKRPKRLLGQVREIIKKEALFKAPATCVCLTDQAGDASGGRGVDKDNSVQVC